jgi:hypothetical protein
MIRAERLRDRAMALTVAAFVALTPPILWAFGRGSEVFGAPLLYVYVFLVWLLAILAGARVARQLSRLDEEAEPAPPPEGPATS